MLEQTKIYYRKRAQKLIANLKSRHFEGYFCETGEEALSMALGLIPEGATVGWGGAMSACQIGLQDAIRAGKYQAIDREAFASPAEKEKAARDCLSADYFITGVNALSMDGQMVNIDGIGNRVAAIAYGPRCVIVIAGMNKVCDDLDAAIKRARTVAAPLNNQRFPNNDTPCQHTGTCADCRCVDCICNQILITRHCRPAGRIKLILVGEDLGF